MCIYTLCILSLSLCSYLSWISLGIPLHSFIRSSGVSYLKPNSFIFFLQFKTSIFMETVTETIEVLSISILILSHKEACVC